MIVWMRDVDKRGILLQLQLLRFVRAHRGRETNTIDLHTLHTIEIYRCLATN